MKSSPRRLRAWEELLLIALLSVVAVGCVTPAARLVSSTATPTMPPDTRSTAAPTAPLATATLAATAPPTPAVATIQPAPVVTQTVTTNATSGGSAQPAPDRNTLTPDRPFGARSKDGGCSVHDGLPDSACTPGAVFPDVTAAQVCQSGYSSSVRNVPAEVSREVYAEYGIGQRAPGEYEVDHLVPLELGGSNDIANLWPEAAQPKPGFHEKDRVENFLHDRVCGGGMALLDAQRAIATNWVDVYEHLPQRAAATTVPRVRPRRRPQ